MPFDGSGGFQRVMNWTNDALAGIKIKSDRHDEEDNNLAAGLSNTITKDGQTQPTADIPLNGKKLTNVGQPIDPQDAATKNYADAIRNFSTGIKLTGTTAAGVSKAYIGFVEADMSIVARTGPDRIVFNDKVDGTGTDILLAPATALPENLIVNGAMQLDQENGNAAGPGDYYPADEWRVTKIGTSVVSSQRVQSKTPSGSDNRIRLTVTTADATMTANDSLFFRHRIEGNKIEQLYWGTPSAKPLILRFWLRVPVAGTYGIAVRNFQGAAATRSFIRLLTVGAGQINTAVQYILTYPGDTSGTWATDNTPGIDLCFTFACGPTYHAPAADLWQAGGFITTAAQVNGLATVGNTFDLMDVGAYIDWAGNGVPPPWQMPVFDENLQRCQRYFQTGTSRLRWTPAAAGQVQASFFPFPTQMRSAPAITQSVGTAANISAHSIAAVAGAGGNYQHTATAGGAGGADSNLSFSADARM